MLNALVDNLPRQLFSSLLPSIHLGDVVFGAGMGTLADELIRAGLEPSARPSTPTSATPSSAKKPVLAQKRRRTVGPAEHPSIESLFALRLPRLGTVVRLQDDRGFGFISDPAHGDVFFHVRGCPTHLPDGKKLPPVGSQVVFILGRDSNRPADSKQAAVAWAPVTSLGLEAIRQEHLDEMRRARLAELPLEKVWELLASTRNARSWPGNVAPTDLQDEILGQEVLERLRGLSPADLEAHRVSSRLADTRYAFAAQLRPDNPACQVAQLLENFQPDQLAKLGAPDAHWAREAKRSERARSHLLEWHLLSRLQTGPRGDWESVFPGTDASEVALATRYLGHGGSVDSFISSWLDRIARHGLLSETQAESWVDRSPDLALPLFPHLSPTRQAGLLGGWKRKPAELLHQLKEEPARARTILAAVTLSFDLETDGDRIWEIGCCRNGKEALLYEEGGEADLDTALADLRERMGDAPLVVGHNVLEWDWPVLGRRVDLMSAPPVWDTLLVSYLMKPQAASHALGGQHRADQDAADALELFRQQLQAIPAGLATRVLLGEFSNAAELFAAIIDALRGTSDITRAPPNYLTNAQASLQTLVVVPERRLHEVNWVAGVSVVPAEPSDELPSEFRVVDVKVLKESLLLEAIRSPASQALLAVAEMTAAQRVELRRNMVPLWLIERDSALRAAVDRASVVPTAHQNQRVAALPARVSWWTGNAPSSCFVAGLNHDVLVLHRERVTPNNLPQTRNAQPGAFARMGKAGSVSRWLLLDRAAQVLDPRGGLEEFTAVFVGEKARREEATWPSSRPLVLRRRRHVLHPRAEDQESYWAEMLRSFKEVATTAGGAVPILLITSSADRTLSDVLATGLAEMGLGEAKPEYRSQREHLLRASRSGLLLVDRLSQWPAWQALAQSAGVKLQPVIEALPIEEWHAQAETQQAAISGAAPSDSASDPDARHPVSSSSLLESIPTLTRAFLHSWLADVGLSTSLTAVVLIDPRVSDSASSLGTLVEALDLPEAPLTRKEAEAVDVALSPFKLVREEAPSGLEAMEQFLVANWQPRAGTGGNAVAGFKPSQKVAMEAISARTSNVLVSLPTGEGKSVLFQVPALCRGLRNRRLTLVVSPLKALMRDQVERLREQGFAESVDYLSGDRSAGEMAEVIQGVLDHRIVLLYIAPERMRSSAFIEVLLTRMQADAGLEHVVVDEAHCVSQWGYEFRPDYFHAVNTLLGMCRAVERDATTPYLLLSATITASDRGHLQSIMSGELGGAGSALPLVAKPEAFTNPLRAHIAVQPRRVRGMLNDRRNFDKTLAERLPHIEAAITAAQRNQTATGQRSAVIVFVSSRHHAELLAQRLATATGGRVDYYHAGLDAGSREEIYTRFLDGDLDVLVATKAFGMGMDIPDIHWVVHLGPPGYLEDYLQEVGRIGRGERERKNARLDKLSATLLYSDEDFESVRTMRARGALTLPIVRDLYQKVCEHAYSVDHQRLAIVPAEGYGASDRSLSSAARRAAATRTRMGLYWLERAGRLHLCGSVPDLVEVTAFPSSLERVSKEGGAAAELALLVLEAASGGAVPAHEEQWAWTPPAPAHTSGSAGEGALEAVGRLFSRLSTTIGLLFGQPARAPQPALPAPAPALALTHGVEASALTASGVVVVLNLSQAKLRTRALASMGDVLSALADLEKRGAVSLKRAIDVVPRDLASDPPLRIRQLFHYVDAGVTELIRRLGSKGRVEFNPFELVEDVEGPEVEDKARRTYERAFINGFRSLARSSGIRLRQLVQVDDKVIWEAILPKTHRAKADARRQRCLRGAQGLLAAVKDEASVPLPKVIDILRAASPDGRFREAELNKVTGLLSAMNLVSISPDLLPLSHVVALNDVDGRLEDHAEIWDELRCVNELAEARNLAMEIFANVRPEAHTGFIEGYFANDDAAAVKRFLDTQLGEILTDESNGPSTLLLEMQEKLRATKAVEFFERFKASEEPAQWEVAKAQFDQNILVNAGPGAGKTSVLVCRIAHLIREQNIDPSQIVVLAFNRAVVFEIRQRIRELFKSLGYAAYAGRLRVSTFHALALRSFAREGVEVAQGAMETLLRDFANRLSDDPSFARRVADGARCLLVDEFQDMTDDVYRIVKHLHEGSGSRAGVMVIGDDDQDILRWQRKNDGSAHEFSEKYFDRFERDFGGETFSKHLLGVNFRSGETIVARSQAMIAGFFERTTRSRRLKNSQLRPRSSAGRGSCERIDWSGRSWEEAVELTATMVREKASSQGGSVAVLCRSNAEVAEAHRILSKALPDLRVQGGDNLSIADLRHVASWLDHIRAIAAAGDLALSDDLRRTIGTRMREAASLPEVVRPNAADVSIDQLWELCLRERSFPHLSSLIGFVSELKMDEFVRLSRTIEQAPAPVVSTLHKVKGLEFDHVVMLPSTMHFGGDGRARLGADLKGDAAEEARLLYVGMTRAKKDLTYFRGDRELSWGRTEPEPYSGVRSDGRVLVGSMKDVALGWASQKNAFNPEPDECQRYIEAEVAVGDPIILGGRGGGAFKAFMHRGASGQLRQIGFLALKHGTGGPDASLKVSAVVRFRPSASDGALGESVHTRGWGYAVLVSGRLR